MEPNDQPGLIGRRELLSSAGVLGLGALGSLAASVLKPAIARGAPVAPLSPAAAMLREPLFRRSCTLTPDNVQGPYYLDLDLVRRNITEARPGLPLSLFFKVVRQSDCAPMPGVVIDIWHTDALGVYSGFASEGTLGQTFMRGVQFTDVSGFAYFESLYPGWYHGRTTHVHLKVYPTLDGTAANLTTQLFFLDPLTNLVYQLVAPYTQRGPKDTTNAQDNFYTQETQLPWIIAPGGAGLWAGIVLVVP